MKILLFTGAGIGVPLGLPTTTEFNKVIAKGQPEIKALVQNYLADSKNDIEKVLYTLEEFIKNNGFLFSYLESKKNNTHHQNVLHHLSTLETKAKDWIQEIKLSIYKILQEFDTNKAYKLYSELIKELKFDEKNSISFFTTNYDLTFENAIYDHKDELIELDLEDVYYGFETELGKMLYNPEQDFAWNPKIIEYLKLHGSLDWVKDGNGNCAKSGAISTPAEPNSMPLLYPGYKDTPTEDPFMSLHEKLYSRLIQSNICVVVGFAFRDPYINNIFEFALKANKKLKVFCYNPSKLDELPTDSNLPLLVENHKNFNYIQEGIGIKANPLKLKEKL